MKTDYRLLILSGLLLFIFVIVPLQASEQQQVAVFQYQTDAGETVALSIGRTGLKFDIGSGADQMIIIYRSDTSPAVLYMAQPAQKMGFKITYPELRRVSAQLNNRYRQMQKNMEAMLRDIPAEDRERFRQTMPDFSTISLDTAPVVQFVREKDIHWKNHAAGEGHLSVDGETRGQIVLLDSPPVSVSDAHRKTLAGFQKILNGWVQILTRQAPAGSQDPYQETRNLLGEYHLRLARFEEHGEIIELKNWRLTRRPKQHFHLPADINVQPVEAALMAPGGGN